MVDDETTRGGQPARPPTPWAEPAPAELTQPLERAVTDFLVGGGTGRPLFEARSEPPDGYDLVVRPVLAPSAAAAGSARAGSERARRTGAMLPAGGGTPWPSPWPRPDAGPAAPGRGGPGRGDSREGAIRAVAPGAALPGEESLRRREFDASPASALVLVPASGDGPVEVLVGLGPAALVGTDVMRSAGAAAARRAAAARHVTVDLRGLPDLLDEAPAPATEPAHPRLAAAVQAFVEGYELASYRYESMRGAAATRGEGRHGAPPPARGSTAGEGADGGDGRPRVVVVCEESGAAELGVERGTAVAGAVRLARDLVNTPAGHCTPGALAEVARRLAGATGISVTVLDAEGSRTAGLGGLLGVARGSSEPPVLVRLAYEPELDPPPEGFRRVALVGKGITFDSGGLSLKPAEGMMTMKTDMSGAAAVLATLASCRRLGIGARVSGFMPLTENMPGASATKPGDVLRIRNGATVEVLNTDAEGRLVLADALSLALEEGPDQVVDLATLTGAQVVALGRFVAGLMGNDDVLLGQLEAAAARAGEAVWRLPLPLAYRQDIDSTVADVKNIGKPGQAGALVAGLFLQAFADGAPWAHLDIAGPARSDGDEGWLRPGGTGFGVRTLVELLAGDGWD